MLFQIKSLSVHYNKVRALRAVSMEVDEGDIVTLIGSNGAGKSTTLRTVSGLVRASAGEIWFDGTRIDKLPPTRWSSVASPMCPRAGMSSPSLRSSRT